MSSRIDDSRLHLFAEHSARLALLSDHRLLSVLSGSATAAGPPEGGIGGGTTATLTLDAGRPVFVKSVPLTRTELRPENRHSTANLFGLPAHYHYGLGSAGFGAWRELAAHRLANGWVLSGDCAAFPLLYHARIVPAEALPSAPAESLFAELGGLEGAVAHWEGSAAVRHRLTEIAEAPARLLLFLEYLPTVLGAWLQADETPLGLFPAVAGQLRSVSRFLRAQGFAHFDAHPANVLVATGDQPALRFADFGLSLSSDFELDADEREFLAAHAHYDEVHTAAHLARQLEQRLEGGDRATPDVAELRERYAPVRRAMDGFRGRLLGESLRTPFLVEPPAPAPAGSGV